jgi:putative membrane protein
MEQLSLLFGTVLLRPYVFVFLAVFLTIATVNMGAARTIIFTLLAYSIAFLSEYSSTRNGFPYGFYTYIETTRNQELWISNIPFMDSLSYSFLSYFSYTMSLLIWSPLKKNGWDIQLMGSQFIRSSFRVIFTGAGFVTLLDIVIDPVALHGDRWFLGLIYSYKEKGEYFNIPLTNFAGWFLVGATILYFFSRIDIWLGESGKSKGVRKLPGKALLGPAVYFGVLAFNLGVTFYIGETLMGICGLLITAGILALVLYKIKKQDIKF